MRQQTPIRVGADHERRYPGAQKLATETVVNVLRAGALLNAELNRKLRAFGLSLATFNVLMILDGDDRPLCPYEIGDRLLVTRGTVTGLLDSLERLGMTRRFAHPDDRRMLLVEMTPKARKTLSKLSAEFFPLEVEATSCLNDRERRP
ncbi:MAG: MarR family winged helix-turn-helix transcriptional regulator [Actinomycetota bacterium]